MSKPFSPTMAGESHSLLQPNGEALEAACCCSEVIQIQYPLYIKNSKTKKEYKMKLLMENQERLLADYYKNGNISNLNVHTDHPLAWHSAILTHSVKREGGVTEGWEFRILDNEDSESANINLYKSGTVLVQGNPKQLQRDFPRIKELAQQEKLSLEKIPPPRAGQTRPLHYITPQTSHPKWKVNLPAQSTTPSKI